MTGVLKVDTIQRNNGAIPTAADLGLNISGNVVQVVQQVNTNSSYASTSSTSFVDSGLLTLSITPKYASSKIHVYFKGIIAHHNLGSATNYGPGYCIYRSTDNSTYSPVNNGNVMAAVYVNNTGTAGFWADHMPELQYLDSPSYALGQTIYYKVYARKSSNGSDTWIHHGGGIGANFGKPEIVGIAREVAA